MKIRTDFVTNSSSSSSVIVCVVDGDKGYLESFYLDQTSASFHKDDDFSTIGGAISGAELLHNLEKFFRGGYVSNEMTKHSEKIKDIGTIENGAVDVIQTLSYDSGATCDYHVSYFIKDGVPLKCEESAVSELYQLTQFEEEYDRYYRYCPIDLDARFDRVPDFNQVKEIIETLNPGMELRIKDENALVTDDGILIGHLKEFDEYRSFCQVGKAEIIKVEPLSKRRKGSKYPLMTVRIKPMMNTAEYLEKHVKP